MTVLGLFDGVGVGLHGQLVGDGVGDGVLEISPGVGVHVGDGEFDAEGLFPGPSGVLLGVTDGVTGGIGHFVLLVKQTNIL